MQRYADTIPSYPMIPSDVVFKGRCKYHPTQHVCLTEALTIPGRQFYPIEWQDTANLQYQMTMAQIAGDTPKQRKLATLIETAENNYAFTSPAYLNSLFPDIVPMSFQNWFTRKSRG